VSDAATTTGSPLDEWFSSLDLDTPQQVGTDEVEAAFLRSAAVLSTFDPKTLRPFGVARPKRLPKRYLQQASTAKPHLKSRPADLRTLAFADAAEPIDLDPATSPRWTLRDESRRVILRDLADDSALQAALEANPQREKDSTQEALDRLLVGDEIEIEKLSRDELAGFLRASTWLDGIIDGLPDTDDLDFQLRRVELIKTFQKLVGDHFAGRESELRQLRDFIGFVESDRLLSSASRFLSRLAYSLVSRPPLVIHGPGGVGKSTLVAKFILEHLEADQDERFPFAYLNFDRSKLRPDLPLTLLREVALQLKVQFGRSAAGFSEFAATIRQWLDRQDHEEPDPSTEDWSHILLPEFSALLEQASPGDAPLVVVLDTFEEVQFRGQELVDVVWTFLDQLQRAVPRLRSVIAGRAPLRNDLPAENLELRDFDDESALAVLRHQVERFELGDIPEEVLAQVVDTVGGNPLSLLLAARLMREEGAKALRSLKTRRLFFLRMKSEQIQAVLHGRILKHLHDEDLAKIAYPGLLVRRITPDVILEVLSGPCELDLDTHEDAVKLFWKLKREVALVEPDEDDLEPLVVRHRENVRRVMLEDLDRVKSELADRIHRKAIAFYRDRDGLVARAEEIYHRLRLGQSAETIDKYWEPGVEERLATALEDLQPKARALLATRLGITPGEKDLEAAEQEDWEHAAFRRANTYLKVQDYDRALAVLHERRDRIDRSELFALEVRALRGVGQLDEARVVAEDGLDKLNNAGAAGLALEIVRLLILIEEEAGRLDEALQYAAQMEDLADSLGERTARLRGAVARARLLRKIGTAAAASRRKIVIERINSLLPRVTATLRGKPALYREIAAEIGDQDFKFLRKAIKNVGVEIASPEDAAQLADSLAAWDLEIRGAGIVEDEKSWVHFRPLAEQAGLDPEEDTDEAWTRWILRNRGSRLGRDLVRYLKVFPDSNVMQGALTESLRTSVDRSIHQTSRMTTSTKTKGARQGRFK
jgi:tetratricopeptide (TPR) repeat protein